MGQKRQYNNMDVQIGSKNMNGHHCNILYDLDSGWMINETGKDKVSTKGTFVYIKNHKQFTAKQPSSLIPIAKKQEFKIGLRSGDYTISFDMRYQDKQLDDLNASMRSTKSQ